MYSDLNNCYSKCINFNKEIVNLPSTSTYKLGLFIQAIEDNTCIYMYCRFRVHVTGNLCV